MTNPLFKTQPLRIAIIGAGPAGLYCIAAIQKQYTQPYIIDVFDRLPTPYGLLRGGVAPDHQKMKSLERFYEKLFTQNSHVSFYGNITIGHDISVQTLKNYYDAIIIACGAETDKPLAIPGAELPGHYAATAFVGWYNGHPDYYEQSFNLSASSVAIIGQGNVAIDVARILGKTSDELHQSDMPEPVITALATSAIRDIHLIGRRGPVQAAFTHLELNELGTLSDCDICMNPTDLQLSPTCKTELENSRKSQKNMAVLQHLLNQPSRNATKRIHLHFFKNPTQLTGNQHVSHIVLAQTSLSGPPGRQKATLTDKTTPLPCQLVFRSVGYRGKPMPGIPFDETTGIIPNTSGRVIPQPSMSGLYVSGWIKRGPTGVLGSNKPDADETIQTLLHDLDKLEPATIRDTGHLMRIVKSKGIRPVSFHDWKEIDAIEKKQGQALDKPREKLRSLKTLLAALPS